MPLPTTIPPNWIVRGDLPEIDPRIADEDDLDLLDEDLVQIVDATGTFTLDVGWYPAGDREGRFICRAIFSDQWEDPFEEVESHNCSNVSQWLEGWIGEIQTRLGQTDVISDVAIATVLVEEEIVEAGVLSGMPAQATPSQNVGSPSVSSSHRLSSTRGLQHAA